jgi:hypothetical protein
MRLSSDEEWFIVCPAADIIKKNTWRLTEIDE